MVNSMTGFAARTGRSGSHTWTWDLRSVNSRGLDLRLRVPDWIDGLEIALRARLGAKLQRGAVALGLKLTRDDADRADEGTGAALERTLRALAEVARAAEAAGLALRAASPAEVLGLTLTEPGHGAPHAEDVAALRAALLADFEVLLADFLSMRAREGESLAEILHQQIAHIERAREASAACVAARAGRAAESLRDAVRRIMDTADGIDENRLVQELALLAVKSDVTEELDRLGAHVHAARDLLTKAEPVGRKLEFLTQEFNREANTLCAKSQDVALTRIGLDLKAVIDQMREQVQNVE